MAAAAMPRARNASTWFFMSAMSGDTTTVVPGRSSAGSWKQSDLPEPVGMTATRSRPSSTRAGGLLLSGPKGLEAEVKVEGLLEVGERDGRGAHRCNLLWSAPRSDPSARG